MTVILARPGCIKIGSRLTRLQLFVALLFFLFGTGIAPSNSAPYSAVSLVEPESLLIKSIGYLERGDLDRASQEIELLLEKQPDFRLALLIQADILSARAGNIRDFGEGDTSSNSQAALLLEEAKRRVRHQYDEDSHGGKMVPSYFLKLSASQKRVILVDADQSRVHVFENDGSAPKLVHDYYATVGKNGLTKTLEGDGRTPEGLYFISSKLNPLGLSDLYGDGALPLNYPNEWDQLQGNTGYGIWLHGVPSRTYNRAPYATEGCIALPNSDIASLYGTPDIENTPVAITSETEWITSEEAHNRERYFTELVERWRLSRESDDAQTRGQFYSSSFGQSDLDDQSFFDYKTPEMARVVSEVSDLSLFAYPGDSALIVATFDIHNIDNNEQPDGRIRQYWRKEADANWRIVHEGSADYRPVHFRGIPKAIMPVIALGEPPHDTNHVLKN